MTDEKYVLTVKNSVWNKPDATTGKWNCEMSELAHSNDEIFHESRGAIVRLPVIGLVGFYMFRRNFSGQGEDRELVSWSYDDITTGNKYIIFND